MKTITKIMIAMVITLAVIQLAQAQNYKAPKIDASGKVTDENGEFLGTVTTEGIITDASGAKVAHVDSEGTLLDKDGKKIGKGEKNGNFAPHYTGTPDKGWTTSAPMNGTCLVKDHEGHVKAEVHENYKQFGACAIHCLTNSNHHHK